MTILIIEGNEKLLSSLRNSLRHYLDLHCLRASSAMEAIRYIEGYRPDVVFLDHHLSGEGGDGMLVVEHFEHVEVLFYATTTDEHAQDEYRARGIATRPKNSINQLINTIDRHMSGTQSSQEVLQK